MDASEVGKEIQYLLSLLHDVQYLLSLLHELPPPTNVYEDNLARIVMSTNPVRQKSSHHMDMCVHYCLELQTTYVMKLFTRISWLMISLRKAYLDLLVTITVIL
jgi:hypothetical protein